MTTAADALVLLFNALAPDEQDEAFERLSDVRLRRLAGSESDSERFVSSLRRVAEYVGHPPSVDEYKQASKELVAASESIQTFSRLYAHYGTWPRAKEALSLSATTTALRIEARFRYRRIGKVWRFTEAAMRDALLAWPSTIGRCVNPHCIAGGQAVKTHFGRVVAGARFALDRFVLVAARRAAPARMATLVGWVQGSAGVLPSIPS